MITVEQVSNGFIVEVDGVKHIARNNTEATEIFRDYMEKRYADKTKQSNQTDKPVPYTCPICGGSGCNHSSDCPAGFRFLRRQAV